MMDFSHVDASGWPRVVARDASGNERIATFEKGTDFIETSSGIVLMLAGLGKLALLTEDADLMAQYEARRKAAYARLRKASGAQTFDAVNAALNHAMLSPERIALVAKMKTMHERGEA